MGSAGLSQPLGLCEVPCAPSPGVDRKAGRCPPDLLTFHVSVADTRAGQEQLTTVAGVAHHPCKDPGGKSLKQCPHSERVSWGGLCPVSPSTLPSPTPHERGIQLGPKSSSVAWNTRVTVAAGSAPLPPGLSQKALGHGRVGGVPPH